MGVKGIQPGWGTDLESKLNGSKAVPSGMGFESFLKDLELGEVEGP